jgi:hypothetical protein
MIEPTLELEDFQTSHRDAKTTPNMPESEYKPLLERWRQVAPIEGLWDENWQFSWQQNITDQWGNFLCFNYTSNAMTFEVSIDKSDDWDKSQGCKDFNVFAHFESRDNDIMTEFNCEGDTLEEAQAAAAKLREAFIPIWEEHLKGEKDMCDMLNDWARKNKWDL